MFILLSAPVFGQRLSPVDITIMRDSLLLKGRFFACGKEQPAPTVILLGGFPGNPRDVLDLGKRLSRFDIQVLTFNYSGTYQSQGKYNFENAQKDIDAVYDFLHQPDHIRTYHVDTSQVYLGGYCFGGGMALTYAATHPGIREVFSIAGNDHGAFMREYARNPEMREMVDQMFDGLKAPEGPASFGEGGTPKEMDEMNLIENQPRYDLTKCASMLSRKHILLIAGWDDRKVSVEHVVLPLYRSLMVEAASHVRLVAFQDGHSFGNSREELTQEILMWLMDQTHHKDP